ncbi:MAG: ABC transporter permease [Deltaproteobacteria bacterium]|nr:ABC transporter permease [Deltaproteobacteria bacterium]
MLFFVKQAIQDILSNRFLYGVTVITIAFSILIVSAFGLFFLNVYDMIYSWKKEVRMMVYLKKDINEDQLFDLKRKIKGISGISNATFISRDEALKYLKEQMKRQSSLLDNLEKNPLPDAFEITISQSIANPEKIESIATRVEVFPQVEDVEYGQRWIGRFINIFNLFRLAGFTMSCLFLMATVFIVANTIRLVLYSKREELEIMRIVGASNIFIKAPFYIVGILEGAVGGVIGIAGLFIAFSFISSSMEQTASSCIINIRFFPLSISCGIIFCSIFVAWLGCYFSLRQFLKV